MYTELTLRDFLETVEESCELEQERNGNGGRLLWCNSAVLVQGLERYALQIVTF